MREYELMYILSPEVSEEAASGLMERVGQLVTRGGGEMAKQEPWGKKKLAYSIREFREGLYVLSQFKLPPRQIGELERNLKLTPEILRYLLIRLEK